VLRQPPRSVASYTHLPRPMWPLDEDFELP